MNDLASLLKSIDIPDLNRTIEKGTVISIKDDIAEKFIKDRNNNPPYFVTKKFRKRGLEKKGYSANEHYWIFLKTYHFYIKWNERKYLLTHGMLIQNRSI